MSYYIATDGGYEGWNLTELKTLKEIQEYIQSGNIYSSFKILKDASIYLNDQDPDEKNIDVLQLSRRPRNSLRLANIHTISELKECINDKSRRVCSAEYGYLGAYKNMGPKSCKEVLDKLNEYKRNLNEMP